MSRRAHIPLKTKLAAALCHMLRADENGNLVRIIPHEEAKRLSEEQIISRFHFDHDPIPHAHGGPDAHWNLPPKLAAEHREKTARNDIPAIAKSRRVVKAEAQHQARMAAKASGDPVIEKPRKKWASRPFPKGRGFQKRGGR